MGSSRAPRLAAALLAALAAAALPAGASAQDAPSPDAGRSEPARAGVVSVEEARLLDAARDLGRDGVRHFENGNWERARELFRQAYALVPAPTLALREARALVRLGRLVEAAEAYARAASAPSGPSVSRAFRAASAEASQELTDLRARIPRLLVTVEGDGAADAQVEQDGRDLPRGLVGVERAVDPGTHRLRAYVADREVSAVVVLRERQSGAVVLRLPAPPRPRVAAAPPPSVDAGAALRPLGWIGVGVGAAAMSLGVTAGAGAAATKADLDRACAPSGCPAASRDDLDTFGSLRALAIAGCITGAVLATGGVAVLLLTSGAPSQRSTTIAIGPGSVSLGTTF